jgi:hypothetical protein
MLYVERNAENEIIAIHPAPTAKATEQKSVMDKELIDFLNANIGEDPWLKVLSMSDMGTVRILEDLIDVLIRKNVILLTDLPEEAQTKIRERKIARQKISTQEFMVDDII